MRSTQTTARTTTARTTPPAWTGSTTTCASARLTTQVRPGVLRGGAGPQALITPLPSLLPGAPPPALPRQRLGLRKPHRGFPKALFVVRPPPCTPAKRWLLPTLEQVPRAFQLPVRAAGGRPPPGEPGDPQVLRLAGRHLYCVYALFRSGQPAPEIWAYKKEQDRVLSHKKLCHRVERGRRVQ